MPAPSPRDRQQALSALSTLSRRDLAAIWRKLDLSRPDRLAEPLAQVLAEIADRYGAAAAALAADWYDEAREDAGAAGTFTAQVATGPDAKRFEALSRWGVTPLFGAVPNGAAALTLLTGGLQRIVLDQARDTTAGSVAADPARPRFARHASANACAFCIMLATRGPEYTSRDAAVRVTGRRGKRPLGSKYHDDCHCVPVEVFPGVEYAEAPYVTKWRQTYNDVKVTSGQHGAIDRDATLAELRAALGTN